MAESNFINIDEINTLLSYSYDDGKVYWLVSRGRQKAGTEAGAKTAFGRKLIMINKKRYSYSRIAYALYHNRSSFGLIDHIDGDPSNNRIDNLREVDKYQNIHNRKVSKNNKLGHKNISIDGNGKYVVMVMKRLKNMRIGAFDTLEKAIAARDEALEKYHGEYRRV